MYLKIANKGLADPQALLTLGISTSRGNENYIGMFGSGACNAIATLLRNSLSPSIYIDNLQMHFITKHINIENQTFNKVMVKYGGRNLNKKSCSSTEECGFTTEWGAIDWTNTDMALREFVANAIDASVKMNSQPVIECVDKPRAKEGFTQVFIPLTPNVLNFYQNIDKWFLYFKFPNAKKIIHKLFPNENYIRIYKKGVLVCVLPGKSMFDYNLGEELRLDESRNAYEWDIRYAVSKALANADSTIIEKILLNLDCWETSLDPEYLKNGNQDNWKKAFNNVFPDSIVSSNPINDDFIKRKGYKPVRLPDSFNKIAQFYQIPNENSILDEQERQGRQLFPPTSEMVQVTKEVWNKLNQLDLTNNQPFPQIFAFTQLCQAGTIVFGEAKDGKIFLNQELGGIQLKKTVIEELTHHITNSKDFTRDFQEFLITVIAKLM